MNILIHMGDPYPDESPAAKRMRVFGDVWTELGHHVVVMAPKYEKKPSDYGNTIYCPTIKMKRKSTMMRMLNQLSFAFTSLFYSLKAGKADIVMTTSPPVLISITGWMIAKMKGAKLVYDVRDIWPDVAWEMGSFSKNSIFSRVFGFIRDFMLKHADLVTAVSLGKVNKLQEYAPKAKILFVTNGLDELFLKNSFHLQTAKKYGLTDGFNCVYIGNLGWAQGLMQLMHLAEKTKKEGLPVRFILFGSGVEEQSLRKYAMEHQLDHVVFADRLPNEEMFTVLSSAQLSFVSLVNSNLKDSVPTKMFEALGVGCPVLLAAVGDAAEIVNACRLGIAAPPNDDEALWNAFLSFYSDSESYLVHKEHAQHMIQTNFSRQKAALYLEGELKKLLNA